MFNSQSFDSFDFKSKNSTDNFLKDHVYEYLSKKMEKQINFINEKLDKYWETKLDSFEKIMENEYNNRLKTMEIKFKDYINRKNQFIQKKMDLLYNQFIQAMDIQYETEEELLDLKMEECHDAFDDLKIISKKMKNEMEDIEKVKKEIIEENGLMKKYIVENIGIMMDKTKNVVMNQQKLNIETTNFNEQHKINEKRLINEMNKFENIVRIMHEVDDAVRLRVEEYADRFNVAVKFKTNEYEQFVQDQHTHIHDVIQQSLIEFEKELGEIVIRNNKKINVFDKTMMHKDEEIVLDKKFKARKQRIKK